MGSITIFFNDTYYYYIIGNMKCVLDTNILVAAIRSPQGASSALMKLTLSNKIKPLVSVPLFLEYESVLLRPKHLEASKLSRSQVLNFLDVLSDFVEPIEIFYLWRPQLKDIKDDMVLELAVNGQADVIVTFNTKDFKPTIDKFNLELMLPNQFLKVIQHGDTE
ncbi:MAG: putative toxin-antitoxin system toxin component, PIN family [Methylococcales bacterium]